MQINFIYRKLTNKIIGFVQNNTGKKTIKTTNKPKLGINNFIKLKFKLFLLNEYKTI